MVNVAFVYVKVKQNLRWLLKQFSLTNSHKPMSHCFFQKSIFSNQSIKAIYEIITLLRLSSKIISIHHSFDYLDHSLGQQRFWPVFNCI